MKLYVIFGHGNGDPGATGFGFTEAERVRALMPFLIKHGGNNVVILDPSRDWFKDGGIMDLNLDPSDCLIEIHLDWWSTSDAHGGHIIIYEGYDADQYDKALANYIGNMFPGRSQKIVGDGTLGNVLRSVQKNINYRLIEICFISCESDLNKYNNNLEDIAKGILKCFNIGSSTNTVADQKVTTTTTKTTTSNSTSLDSAKSFDKNLARAYTCTDNLNLRTGASTNKTILITMPRGTRVVCHGYYTETNGTKWLCITTTVNNKNYTGYCSKDYLS